MEKIWLKNYPSGVPELIKPEQYESLVEIFEESFKKFSDQDAFACMGKVLTYSDIEKESRAFASYLQKDLGLKKGDRVAIMMPNLLQYPIALMGILRAGCIVVNVNPLYTARELKHQLKDSGAETIVIVSNFATTLEKVRSETPIKNIVLTELGDLLGFPKSLVVNFVVKKIKKMVPAFSLEGAISFNEALTRGRNLTYDRPKLAHDDLAFLQYTGGTTGVSKGAMLTHKNMIANTMMIQAWLGPSIQPGKDKVVTPLPLYHIFSLSANLISFFSLGGLNILITNPRDIPGFVKELKKWDFTALTGVNTLFNALVNNEEFKNLDFSHLKLSIGGGMAVQKAVAEKWKSVTGTPLLEGYGLTESSPVVTINPINIKNYTGSIGLPVPSTEVSIRNEEGKELGIGESGELWVRGPQVMLGYWNLEEETKDMLTQDGWLKTGDVAEIDGEGFARIVDRKKDMILVSGFNVYPNEVEDVVAQHPGVLEVAAVGIPNESSGEVVKIFVVKKDPSLTKEALISHCKTLLTGYKVPKLVEFRDDLPKTNVGKILRRALRDESKASE